MPRTQRTSEIVSKTKEMQCNTTCGVVTLILKDVVVIPCSQIQPKDILKIFLCFIVSYH